MNFKKATLLALPLVLLCSCGQQPSGPQYLVKTIDKSGETKESALMNGYTEYIYKNGEISEEVYYECNEGKEAELTNRTVYNKNTDTEFDCLQYSYDGGKFSSLNHIVKKYNDKGDITYELTEYKYKEEDPFTTNIEYNYTYTYDNKGNMTSSVAYYTPTQDYSKEEYSYDNSNRLIENISSRSHGKDSDYKLLSKYVYSYVDSTNYLAEEKYYTHNEDFILATKTVYTYNSSMLPTLTQTYDSEQVIVGSCEYVYEGKKVTRTRKQKDVMITFTLQIVECIISEYASDYHEGMDNPLVETEILYFYGTPMDKMVQKYTYRSNGDFSFHETEHYKITGGDQEELTSYESTEFIYGTI